MAPQKPIRATIFIADGAISLPAYSNAAGPAQGSNLQAASLSSVSSDFRGSLFFFFFNRHLSFSYFPFPILHNPTNQPTKRRSKKAKTNQTLQIFQFLRTTMPLFTRYTVILTLVSLFQQLQAHPFEEAATAAMLVKQQCAENFTYDASTGSCCKRCEPGFGVALPCTEHNGTVCSPCLDGVMYSPVSSHEDVCRPCSHCPSNSYPLHRCNATHNTKCECIEGYYYQPDMNMCLPCSRCRPGEMVAKPCTSNGDTLCRPCPVNTFMSTSNLAFACLPCSVCRKTAILEEPCSAVQDTRCSDNSSFVEAEFASEDSDQNLILIYCVLFGLFLGFLITYVVIKHFRIKSWPNKLYHCTPKMEDLSSVKYPGNGKSCPSGIIANEIIQYNIANHKEVVPLIITYDTPVSQLPGWLLDQLQKLSCETEASKQGWTTIAATLGYSNDEIDRLRQLAFTNGYSPVEELFNWMRKDSTIRVQSLICALKAAKHVESATLLTKSIERYIVDVV
ncbi:Tumor necrosis factor receptor superfamily member 16 [Trichinella patagoniensis]|uniref:Tumor necrosis factor receptor superfamily member 16 n=1 Tax=Trichinella patagoniensis TaxID=990121 RepID=A0A0V0ZXB4_9BILA|nr:Tumor necrosis factor receptor superfamily member 16 [Trichinella patagoniensis]